MHQQTLTGHILCAGHSARAQGPRPHAAPTVAGKTTQICVGSARKKGARQDGGLGSKDEGPLTQTRASGKASWRRSCCLARDLKGEFEFVR